MFNLALAQYPIHFYKSESDWKDNIEIWIKKAAEHKSNILVFPEYGSMELASLIPNNDVIDLKKQLDKIQALHDKFLNLYIHFAQKYSIYISTPSFPLQIKNKYYNRTYLISPDGKYDFQDKLHMTRFEDVWGISASETELKIFNTRFGKIGIQTCFDIEFPWPSSLLAASGVKLIISPSCTETFHGLNRVHTGARARSLENQIYVGVSPVVGTATWSQAVDINNGYSALYGPADSDFPKDGIINKGILNHPTWLFGEIDFSKIDKVRVDGQVFNFKYNSEYPWEKAKTKNLELKYIDLL
tara:strand:+ start:76923 stop:77822 length:900 start_codon:yes stop_codon:yes gene_type:complete